jgi:hypothetical protein
MSAARDKLRSLALGDKAKDLRKTVVTWEGVEYEVRQPTVAAHSRAIKAAGLSANPDTGEMRIENVGRMQASLAIACTYTPGTDERVFEDADLEAIMGSPAGGFLASLGQVAQSLMKEAEDAGKPSAPSQNGAFSLSSPASLEA